MVNYNKSVIYTIRTGDEVYVGSTVNFNNRKHDHKKTLKNALNEGTSPRRLYQTIIDNDCEWEMKHYEQFPCNNRIELLIEEERVRVQLNASLNMMKCHRRRDDHLNEMKATFKEWYSIPENKAKHQAYSKEIVTCQCGASHKRGSGAAHRKTRAHLDFMMK